MPIMNSTAIRRVEYDPKTSVMQIWFVQGGHSYDFCGVPQSVYDELITASSAGTYYDRYIRDRYQC